MLMLNKVRTALVYPAGLIKYRNDGYFKAFLYIFFFAMIMALVPFLMVMQFDGIPQAARNEIREAYTPPDTRCEIIDATLDCDASDTRFDVLAVDGGVFTIDTHDTFDASHYGGMIYHVVIHESNTYLLFLGTVLTEKPISELHEDVHNIRFDYDEVNAGDFYRAWFTAADQEIIALRTPWAISVGIFTAFSNFILFNIFVLLNTFLTRMRLKPVPFKQMYVMMTYAATLLYIVLIFHELLSIVVEISFFIFIIILFVAFRQMNRLAMELQRRIYRQ